MKLIDKDALVAEIERLKTIYDDNENIRHVAKYNILVDILSFLDTIEVKEIQEESVSLKELMSDLETAADKYAIKMYNMFIEDETILNNKEGDEILSDAFKAGAKWGKNQAKVEIQAQSMALAHGCPNKPVRELNGKQNKTNSKKE